MKRRSLNSLVLSAMLLAAGLILPFFTGQIREIGSMLLPMHIPVLLCGYFCGKEYGLGVGFVLPLLRSVCFGMPVLYPSAVSMAFELAAYGFFAGLLYAAFRRKNLWSVYGSLLISMVLGRLVWGVAQTVLLGLSGKAFSLAAFWAGGFAKAAPGIVLQLILVPAAVLSVKGFAARKQGRNPMPEVPGQEV